MKMFDFKLSLLDILEINLNKLLNFFIVVSFQFSKIIDQLLINPLIVHSKMNHIIDSFFSTVLKITF